MVRADLEHLISFSFPFADLEFKRKKLQFSIFKTSQSSLKLCIQLQNKISFGGLNIFFLSFH